MTTGPRWRWLFVVPGLAAVAYGAYGLWTSLSAEALQSWAVWLVGGALLHDLVVAPVWIGLGWLAARTLPRPARAPVVVGAATSAAELPMPEAWAMVETVAPYRVGSHRTVWPLPGHLLVSPENEAREGVHWDGQG